MQRIRVQNFTVSQDGYATGEGQTLERPFGHADPMELMAWAGATASWPGPKAPGGSRGLDDYFARDFANGIGAEIMGRNKFGPYRGPWTDHEWVGWWGDTPPFHTPVFVLTHHERPSITLADTTFHFVNTTPSEAAQQAKAAAGGLDVRIGGGPTTIRSFLDANLVDEMHVVVAPITLGGGVRLWDSPDDLNDQFEHENIPSPSGVTHHLFGVAAHQPNRMNERMTIDHTLAVVAVSDFDVSHEWYQRLFGTPATNVPMPGSLAEWRVTNTGWLQIFNDPERAGTSMVNFAVADLDQHRASLAASGIKTGEIIEANKGVRLCSLTDPDSNSITFIGSFREQY